MTGERWDLLSGWLTAWISAGPGEREGMRERLATAHPDLIVEADRLAKAAERLGSFLEVPALVIAARDLAADDPQLPAGSMLGPYRVVSLLARGGMGDVYRAVDVRLRRHVAVKVLADTKTQDVTRVERFMHEARVTAALDHPNIVKVFDVGLVDGRAYLVAELLEGETIRSRLGLGPMAAAEARRIAVDIAHGLAAAHAAGLVHRDLKPENVFLTKAGTTKLLDFGIAKLAQDETVPNGLSTLTGVVLGTAGYLSPEQIRGGPVDARSDLFALGAVLFEMLAGIRAFGHEHIVDTLHAILYDSPPATLAQRFDLPDEFTEIVMRLLEKAPEERFQSAGEVISALELVDPSTAPPGTASPLEPTASKSTTGTPTTVTLAVMPFRSIPAGSAGDLLELGLADVFISRLGQLPEIRVLPLTATERLRHEDPRRAAQRLGANRVLLVTLQRDGVFVRAGVQLLSATDGRTVWATTVDTDASSIFSIQDIIVTRVIEEIAPTLAPNVCRRLARAGTRSGSAFEAYLRGRTHVARPTPADLRAAADFFGRALELDAAYVDAAWAGLGSAYKRMPIVGAVDPADAFPKAKAAATRALELDADHPEAHSVLGTVAFWYDWDYAEAERLLRRALALQPSDADTQVFLAHLCSNTGRPDEALDEIRRARALDPAWPPPRALEGQFLFMARRHADAVSYLDTVVEVEPGFWIPHLFRAYALVALERWSEAVAACDRALEIRQRRDPTDSPHPVIVARRALALARLGRGQETAAVLDALRRQARRTYVPAHAEALVLHALGRDDEALATLREAVVQRDVFVTFLAVDSVWDGLRDRAVFRELLEQVHLLDVSDRQSRSR